MPFSRPARLASASTAATAPKNVRVRASSAMHTLAACHGRQAAAAAADDVVVGAGEPAGLVPGSWPALGMAWRVLNGLFKADLGRCVVV